MRTNYRQPLNAIWTGNDLSYIEQICLSSALAVGHPVDLWTYGPIGSVPSGVTLRDAREVMPENMMVVHERKKSPAIGADLFRLLLQQQGRGCYIDCDVLVLKAIPDEPYIFGLNVGGLNNAVLRLPAGSPMLDDMLGMMLARPIMAPWWSWRRKGRQHVRHWFGRDHTLAQVPWGTTGPRAITYFAERHGVAHLAKAPAVFYPLPHYDAEAIFDAPPRVDALITASTIAVHLWHSAIKTRIGETPPAESWIGEQGERLWRQLALTASVQPLQSSQALP